MDEKKSALGRRLWDPWSPGEEDRLGSSWMAREILNYAGKGYNCGESLFLTTLRYLRKPEELVWLATGLGGGMGRREICGLYSAAMLSLGLAASLRGPGREEGRALVKTQGDLFGEWWSSWSPLRCEELKPYYNGDGYTRMVRRVACALERHLVALCGERA